MARLVAVEAGDRAAHPAALVMAAPAEQAALAVRPCLTRSRPMVEQEVWVEAAVLEWANPGRLASVDHLGRQLVAQSIFLALDCQETAVVERAPEVPDREGLVVVVAMADLAAIAKAGCL